VTITGMPKIKADIGDFLIWFLPVAFIQVGQMFDIEVGIIVLFWA
jgi:hypothetical protein